MEQYRSKSRLWSWIQANIRLEIEVRIVVGSEDVGARHQLLEQISLAIRRALPGNIYKKRREMLLIERYANGYLITPCVWSGCFEPTEPTTPPVPMSSASHLQSCVVRGPGRSKRVVARYRQWQRCIIEELSADFGPGFVAQAARDESSDDHLGDNLAAVPITDEDVESGREMFAGLMPWDIGEESEW